MKQTGLAHAIALLSVSISALAQQNNLSTSQLALARCAYVSASPGCLPQAVSSGHSTTIVAQFPRRMAGPRGYSPPPPRMRMVGPMPTPSLKGALIGGLIGFGLGAARSGDTSTKSRVGLGLLVGGLGAVIGAGIGSAMPGHYRPRRVEWPDDETASDRRSGNTSRSKQMSTAPTPERAVDPKTATNRVPEGTGTGLPASDE